MFVSMLIGVAPLSGVRILSVIWSMKMPCIVTHLPSVDGEDRLFFRWAGADYRATVNWRSPPAVKIPRQGRLVAHVRFHRRPQFVGRIQPGGDPSQAAL